jgi:hypothetical protein
MVLDSFTLTVESTILSAGSRVGALAEAGDGRFGRHETHRAEERTLGEHCECRCRLWVAVVLLVGERDDGTRSKVSAKPSALPAAVCLFADRLLPSCQLRARRSVARVYNLYLDLHNGGCTISTVEKLPIDVDAWFQLGEESRFFSLQHAARNLDTLRISI